MNIQNGIPIPHGVRNFRFRIYNSVVNFPHENYDFPSVHHHIC